MYVSTERIKVLPAQLKWECMITETKERNLMGSVITTDSKHNYYPEKDKKAPDLNSGNINGRKRWQKKSKSFSSLE